MEAWCGLLFVIAWLLMVGYMNYRVWVRPEEAWNRHRGYVAGERERYRKSILGLFLVDPLGLEKKRGVFLWSERIIMALLLLVGILALIGLVGQVAGLR